MLFLLSQACCLCLICARSFLTFGRMQSQHTSLDRCRRLKLFCRSVRCSGYNGKLALQGRHEVLSLRSAMVQFYKLENFATAAIFARRLLEKSQTPTQVRAQLLSTAMVHSCAK